MPYNTMLHRMMRSHRFFWTLLLTVTLAGCQTWLPLQSTADSPLKPKVTFTQTPNADILKSPVTQALKRRYTLLLKAALPATQAQQETTYTQIITKVLRAEGFYASKLVVGTSTEHALPITVDAGARYLIESITLHSHLRPTLTLSNIPLMPKLNDPARAEDILSGQQTLAKTIEAQYCLWTINLSHEVLLDHQTHTAQIHYRLEPSPTTYIKQFQVKGVQTLPKAYLENLIELKTGQCFKHKDIQAARLALHDSGLLTQATATLDKNAEAVEVTFEVKERPHRTVRASLGYGLDTNGTIAAGWTHRNFLGRAHRLNLSGRYSADFKTLETQWLQPQVLNPNHNLSWEMKAHNERLSAFDVRDRLFSVRSEHQMGKHRIGSYGLALDRSAVVTQNQGRNYELAHIPVSLAYDSRNDLLNPQTGWFGFSELDTFWNLADESAHFQKISLGLQHYVTKKLSHKSLTLASRFLVAGFTQTGSGDIPTHERYFSGGGASVRGFSYKSLAPQEINPLTGQQISTGGLSLLEVTAELRFQFLAHWGAAVFFDAGNSWSQRTPQLDQPIPQSAGVGLRYLTQLIPVRLDIAMPLNKPPALTTVDHYQLYISIGQAF